MAVRPSVLLAVFGVLLVIEVTFGSPAVSEAQYKQAAKLMRNVCGPKSGLSADALEAISNGSNIPPDRPVKCYLACVLSTAQTLKNGKIDFRMMRMQAEKMLPPTIRDSTLGQMEHCQDKGVGSDNCDVAYDFITCGRDFDPEGFFFP